MSSMAWFDTDLPNGCCETLASVEILKKGVKKNERYGNLFGWRINGLRSHSSLIWSSKALNSSNFSVPNA